MGTAVFSITSPLGRSTRDSTAPTGSGRAATSRIPWAMPAMRSGLSASRSNITSEMVPRAASRSWTLAARMSAVRSSRARAISISARFFNSVSARARAPLVPLAFFSSSIVVIDVTLFKSFRLRPASRSSCVHGPNFDSFL